MPPKKNNLDLSLSSYDEVLGQETIASIKKILSGLYISGEPLPEGINYNDRVNSICRVPDNGQTPTAENTAVSYKRLDMLRWKMDETNPYYPKAVDGVIPEEALKSFNASYEMSLEILKASIADHGIKEGLKNIPGRVIAAQKDFITNAFKEIKEARSQKTEEELKTIADKIYGVTNTETGEHTNGLKEKFASLRQEISEARERLAHPESLMEGEAEQLRTKIASCQQEMTKTNDEVKELLDKQEEIQKAQKEADKQFAKEDKTLSKEFKGIEKRVAKEEKITFKQKYENWKNERQQRKDEARIAKLLGEDKPTPPPVVKESLGQKLAKLKNKILRNTKEVDDGRVSFADLLRRNKLEAEIEAAKPTVIEEDKQVAEEIKTAAKSQIITHEKGQQRVDSANYYRKVCGVLQEKCGELDPASKEYRDIQEQIQRAKSLSNIISPISNTSESLLVKGKGGIEIPQDSKAEFDKIQAQFSKAIKPLAGYYPTEEEISTYTFTEVPVEEKIAEIREASENPAKLEEIAVSINNPDQIVSVENSLELVMVQQKLAEQIQLARAESSTVDPALAAAAEETHDQVEDATQDNN